MLWEIIKIQKMRSIVQWYQRSSVCISRKFSRCKLDNSWTLDSHPCPKGHGWCYSQASLVSFSLPWSALRTDDIYVLFLTISAAISMHIFWTVHFRPYFRASLNRGSQKVPEGSEGITGSEPNYAAKSEIRFSMGRIFIYMISWRCAYCLKCWSISEQ